ncbi:hypothetical protein ACFWPH_33910, partial [Nocardia sp. NPDC058499]
HPPPGGLRHQLNTDHDKPTLKPGGRVIGDWSEETGFRVLDGEIEISTHPRKGGPVTRYIAGSR